MVLLDLIFIQMSERIREMIVLGKQPPAAVFEYRSCNPFSDGATSPTDDLSPIKCLAKLHTELNGMYRLSIKI